MDKRNLLIPTFLSVVSVIGIELTAQPTTSIQFGMTQEILNTTSTGAVTGTTYALPSGAASVLTWQVTSNGSAISVALQGSLDGTNWNQIQALTSVTGISNVGLGSWRFVRATQTSRTGGTSTLIVLSVQRGFSTTSQSSNIASARIGLVDGSVTAPSLYNATDTDTGMYFIPASDTLAFSHLGVQRLAILGTIIQSAASVNPTPDNSRDLGAAANRWKDIYLAGNVKWGTSGSEGMLKPSGNQIHVRSASDAGYTPMRMNTLVLNSGSNITDGPDGSISLFNGAQTDFSMLRFGGTDANFPALKRNGTSIEARLANDSGYAALRGSTINVGAATSYGEFGYQLSGVVFASLGTPSNGFIRYCSDCTPNTSPCTGAGTGAIAKRLNGAWDCR